MRGVAVVLGVVVLLACGSSSTAPGNPNDGTAAAWAGGGATAGKAGAPAAAGTSGSGNASGAATAGVCAPGQQVACACAGGVQSAQACNATGTGYEPCQCAGGAGGVSGSAGTGGAGGEPFGGAAGTAGSGGAQGGKAGTAAGGGGAGGAGGSKCVPSQTTDCTCDPTWLGVATCGNDGAFGACVCDPATKMFDPKNTCLCDVDLQTKWACIGYGQPDYDMCHAKCSPKSHCALNPLAGTGKSPCLCW